MFTILKIAPVLYPDASIFGVETKFQPAFNEMFVSAEHGRTRNNATIRIINEYRKFHPGIMINCVAI
jgi:hypothetical protein